VLISHKNRGDLATLSGGDWLDALPLAYLQDPRLHYCARSDGLAATATRFLVDLGANPDSLDYTIRAFALLKHAMSRTATVRVSAWSNATQTGEPVYDSGILPAWPAMFSQDQVPAGTWAAYQGKPTPEDMSWLWPHWYLFPPSVTARYWWVEIADAANPLGYVDIGRLWLGPAWEPSPKLALGATLTPGHSAKIEDSIGGVQYAGTGYKRRKFSASLDKVLKSEAYQRGLYLAQEMGVSEPVLFSLDPAATLTLFADTSLVRMSSVPGQEHAYSTRNRMSFELEEVL